MRAFVLCAVLVLFPISATAEVLALCGEMTGYTNYHPGTFVPKSKSGWMDDKITGGHNIVTATKNGEKIEYDVIFRDAFRTTSLRQDGFNVWTIKADHRTVHIAAVSHAVTELYVLDKEQRRLSLLSYKIMPIRLTRAMTAKCE